MIGLVSEEIAAQVALTAGEPVELVVEGTGEGAPGTLHGAVVGLRPPAPDDLIERAAAAAAACDAAVLVVGTTDEWETEGHDRAVDGPPRRPGRARSRPCSTPTRTRSSSSTPPRR